MRRIEFREESGSPRALQTGLLYKPSELLEKAMAPPLQYSYLEKSQGQRSLVDCSPWGHYESDTTE